MEHVLNNPVWHALKSNNSHLSNGNDYAKYFDEDVSPFVGLRHADADHLKLLHGLLNNGRLIFLASPVNIHIPSEWKLIALVHGLQMVHNATFIDDIIQHNAISLSERHSAQMVELAKLTKPGPFDVRTIEFGHYQGIFVNNVLVAMAGQRMHAFNFAEISAVCTHPHHTGKGYARQLLINQVNRIVLAGDIPFLHTRSDNKRAITLYESLGFSTRSDMYFYIIKI